MDPLPSAPRRVRAGAWMVGIAVAVRLLYLAQISGMPYFDQVLTAFDQINYHKGALALAAGDWRAPAPNELYAPLYKYLLGVAYWAFGWATDLRVGLARILQLALGVWVSWGVFRLGKACGGTVAGVLASLLYTTFGPALYQEGLLLREFPSTAALLGAVLLARHGPAATDRWLGSAGMLAVACQLRPNLLLLVPVFLLRVRALPGGRARARLAGGWLAAFLLAILPTLLRNHLALADPARRPEGSLPPAYEGMSMLTLEPQGPVVLAVGNHPANIAPGWLHASAQPEALRAYGGVEPPSYGRTFSMILDWAAEDPAGYLRLQARKLVWTLWDGEVPDNHCFQLWQEFSFLLRLPTAHFALLLALAVAALFLPDARAAVTPFLWGCLAAVLAGAWLAYPVGRFRAPTYPFLAVAAGAALHAAWMSLALRRWRRPLAGALSTVVLVRLLWVPTPDWIRRALGMPVVLTREILLRPNDLGNIAFAYFDVARDSDRIDPLLAAEWFWRRAWNQTPREFRVRTIPAGAEPLREIYPQLVRRLLRDEPRLVLDTSLRWETHDPYGAGPHEACAIVLSGAGDARCARRAAMRAIVRNPDNESFVRFAAQAPPADPSDEESSLLARVRADASDAGAHEALASLYAEAGIPHRGAFHLQRLATLGSEADRSVWRGRLSDLECRVRASELPADVPTTWIRATAGR
ncbi:MAG: hypothetical protein HY608_06570 [Planctomycetes bacterium]|nr:hypothetical protein [Planctomycetota bacterium]